MPAPAAIRRGVRAPIGLTSSSCDFMSDPLFSGDAAERRAGFDNETWTELVGPGLTVIEQPVADIGRTARTCSSNACAGRTWRPAR